MAPTDVAIVSFAAEIRPTDDRSEPELLLPVITAALEGVGLTTQDVGFVVSGSTDYLAGRPFSFVSALDAVGAWPPLTESHVEMDGAFALFEALLRLQHGDIDTALVYSFGVSSPSDVDRTLALQLDPYHVAPLFPDARSLAGLQARAALEAGVTTESEVAGIVARSLGAARSSPRAIRSADLAADDVLAQPVTAAPLRDLDLGPRADGCAAMVLATGARARELTETPVWIRGMDHRIESQSLGVRDLADSVSTRQAAAGTGAAGPFDLAELHTVCAYQEPILRRALGLSGTTRINSRGGPLAGDTLMVSGLARFGEAAELLAAGDGQRAVAHATSGPVLQHNLVGVLEVA